MRGYATQPAISDTRNYLRARAKPRDAYTQGAICYSHDHSHPFFLYPLPVRMGTTPCYRSVTAKLLTHMSRMRFCKTSTSSLVSDRSMQRYMMR